MNDAVDVGRFGSGQAVRRVEDPALVAGLGRYTDDVAEPGQLHLVFVRSTHAHARIAALDVDAARAMPGVVAVYTGVDLATAGVKPLAAQDMKRADGTSVPAERPVLARAVV